MKDAPVATRYTRDFVCTRLPQGAREILEIGCGMGELARVLMKAGYQVVAVDSDAECVAKAKEGGVDARQLEWPAGVDGRFDCVLFTRSLHHAHDLSESVTAAYAALRPGGRLIVEDYRAEGASERSAEWYRGLIRTLSASGAFTEDFDFQDRVTAAEPIAGHHLHSSTEIENSLRCFGHVERADAAYFFRYLEGQFRRPEATNELLRHEISLIQAGSIDALGQRFIACQD